MGITIYRAGWGAGPNGGYEMGRADEVYVHHFNSGIKPVRSLDDGIARMRGADAYHRSLGWGAIGYSWCVDDIGNIYEGRGWGHTGAHTYGYNSKGYAVCWLGDSNVALPSQAALEAIAEIIREGIITDWVAAKPTIVAHRDRVPDTSCCGDAMYAQLPIIRRLVAFAPTPLVPVDDEEFEMHVIRDVRKNVWVVTGDRYELLRGDWEKDLNPRLVAWANAGLIRKNADGSPMIGEMADAGWGAPLKDVTP